jgi:orotate phosphoribosyltransferase
MARSRRDRTERARPDLLEILKRVSWRRGQVVLSSGKLSDFFIDCKPAVLSAQGHQLVGELMLDALRGLPRCEAVAGVELGGCPLASAVSLTSQLRGRPVPALYVRKEAKAHGTQQLIEGPLTAGMKVALLEDVITTGGSTVRAVQALRSAGAEVVGVVVLVDRLEGGAEAIGREGLEVVSVFTKNDFLVDDLPLSGTMSDTTMPE